jgi:hypothetical protein
MPISQKDFEPEQGKKDGTLAHAFERFLGLLVQKNGFEILEIGKESNSRAYRFAAPKNANALRGRIDHNPVIVYQMGKVGSMSVVSSLRKAYLDLSLNVPVHHHHLLNNLDEIEQAILKDRLEPDETIREIQRGRELRHYIEAHPEQKWNLISLVRDPVARNVATFFQNLPEIIPDWQKQMRSSTFDIGILHNIFLEMNTIHNAPDAWFDTQMKPVFGIDVYASAFPTESGYKIYWRQPHANLLVVRLEDLNRIASQALQEFLGLENFVIGHTNTTEGKEYAELYQAFKEKPLPHEYVSRMYNTRFARHFYSRIELEMFAKRWLGR